MLAFNVTHCFTELSLYFNFKQDLYSFLIYMKKNITIIIFTYVLYVVISIYDIYILPFINIFHFM